MIIPGVFGKIFTVTASPLHATSLILFTSVVSPACMIGFPRVLCANVSPWISFPRITSDFLAGIASVAGDGVRFASIGGKESSTVTESLSTGFVAFIIPAITATITARITIAATNQIQDGFTVTNTVSSALWPYASEKINFRYPVPVLSGVILSIPVSLL